MNTALRVCTYVCRIYCRNSSTGILELGEGLLQLQQDVREWWSVLLPLTPGSLHQLAVAFGCLHIVLDTWAEGILRRTIQYTKDTVCNTT